MSNWIGKQVFFTYTIPGQILAPTHVGKGTVVAQRTNEQVYERTWLPCKRTIEIELIIQAEGKKPEAYVNRLTNQVWVCEEQRS